MGGSRTDLEEIIVDFLKDAPLQLAMMEEARAAGDNQGLRRCAHSLKSNARDLGAMTWADYCAALERDAERVGDVPDAKSRISVIVALWPQVRAALEAELHEGQAES